MNRFHLTGKEKNVEILRAIYLQALRMIIGQKGFDDFIRIVSYNMTWHTTLLSSFSRIRGPACFIRLRNCLLFHHQSPTDSSTQTWPSILALSMRSPIPASFSLTLTSSYHLNFFLVLVTWSCSVCPCLWMLTFSSVVESWLDNLSGTAVPFLA